MTNSVDPCRIWSGFPLCPYNCYPFDISRKDSFCLAFYFKWKHFVLIDHISSEIICLFVSVFCSQICTLKINLRPKIGLTYAICLVKWLFGILVEENLFYFSVLNLKNWCFTTILWKIQKIEQAELVENLPPSYLPYRFLPNLHSFLLWSKSENIWFIKTNGLNITFCA